MKVTYDSKVCIHAANCVKTLPTVFKVVDGRFVIDQQGADGLSFWRPADHFLAYAATNACPSGILDTARCRIATIDE